jgi:hypothetical protein
MSRASRGRRSHPTTRKLQTRARWGPQTLQCKRLYAWILYLFAITDWATAVVELLQAHDNARTGFDEPQRAKFTCLLN